MHRFDGKVALVTSLGTPVGAAVAGRLRDAGATIAAVNPDFDVASEPHWQRLFDDIVGAHGRLDILVTYGAASYARPMSIADTPLAQFREVMRPNLEGAFLATRHGLLKIRSLRNGGTVIHIASVFATIGLAQQAALSASANGIRMMVKSAALSCAEAKDGIRVNGVQVGPTAETPEGLAGHAPLASRGTPADVAAAVAYLASDAASYITGYVLPVDGGLLAA
jgi:NAD(P)-dependent dehydrogenase (short-subunit alcohol dehydrogenase family)